jgi:hypothetical protein
MSGRHPRHVVLVGGLTDGLLFAGYCRPLAQRLEAQRWSLVQALLSSCHTGYGLASLDQDAEELHQLASHLRAEYGSQVGGGAAGFWRVRAAFAVESALAGLRHWGLPATWLLVDPPASTPCPDPALTLP